MSYEPSHRKPPRQERWPNATPGEGWPAYQQSDTSRTRTSAPAQESAPAWGGARHSHPGPLYWAGENGYGGTTTANPADGGYAGEGYPGGGYAGGGYTDGFDGATDGYAGGGYTDGFDGAADGYAGGYRDGYPGGAADGYGGTQDYPGTGNGYGSWDGHAQPGHEFAGSAGYLPQEENPGLDPVASSGLVAPDTMGEWWRQADRDEDPGQDAGDRGPVVGVVTGLLSAAVAIGVATFAAAFVRPQVSPVSTVADVFTGHLPTALKSPVSAHLGGHGGTVLLLGAVGLAAMVLGYMARRNPSIGVAGIAAFGLLGAFAAVTRPESPASAVIPWAIGGTAGILALLWLARASAPVAPVRPTYGGGRRRTR